MCPPRDADAQMLAKTRGHTVENGGVYIYDNTREASKCSEQDRNLRPRV